MFTLTAALLVGIAAGSILIKYWNKIKAWLDNTAADTVERILGYKARETMFKAISVADKVFRILEGHRVASNVSTVFTKSRNNNYTKLTMINNVSADELGQAYLDEMRNGNNIMELDYNK